MPSGLEAPPVEPAPLGTGLQPLPEDGRRHFIDAHAHLFGESAWDLIGPVMDAVGIDAFFNLSGGSPRQGMNTALELARASGGRVLNMMNINWDGFGQVAFGEIVAEELELCVTRYGYAGLKVSKALGLFVDDPETGGLIAVDDPRLFPMWERAGELGVPVFIHTGDPRAFWEPVTPANERYEELLAHPGWSFAGPGFPPREQLLAQRDHLFSEFPQTTFVAVHFGNNPEDIEYVDRLLSEHPNVVVDIAARIGEIGRHDPARVREVFIEHADRILFATDIAIGNSQRRGTVLVLGSSGEEMARFDEIPTFYQRHIEFLETDQRGIAHPTPIQGRWTVDAINLPEEVLDRVYYQNAYDLVVAPWLARQQARAASEASRSE